MLLHYHIHDHEGTSSHSTLESSSASGSVASCYETLARNPLMQTLFHPSASFFKR